MWKFIQVSFMNPEYYALVIILKICNGVQDLSLTKEITKESFIYYFDLLFLR